MNLLYANKLSVYEAFKSVQGMYYEIKAEFDEFWKAIEKRDSETKNDPKFPKEVLE